MYRWRACLAESLSVDHSLLDVRGSRNALFDDIEEGGIRASSSYSSHEINEHENERAMDGLQDRVLMLKRLTGDIHEEVEGHNRMLDRMGNDMDSSRGILSGTMDKFKTDYQDPPVLLRGCDSTVILYPVTQQHLTPPLLCFHGATHVALIDWHTE
ncbi:bet1-like SNARE 1-1 [Tanacetum coccineum]